MENKIILSIALFALAVSGILLANYGLDPNKSYEFVETGNEITCGTNKPFGFTIESEIDGVYLAKCEFKTKEHVYAFCSEFRSTPSYERYGCKEMIAQEINPIPELPGQVMPSGTGDIDCARKYKGCVEI